MNSVHSFDCISFINPVNSGYFSALPLLINILNLNNESQLFPLINSFKGWQSISLETNFNYEDRNIINSAIRNLYLNISGIYELNRLMPM